MKSSITTTSTEAFSFGPSAVLPLVIRTNAIRSLVKKTPTNERPLFVGGTKTFPSDSASGPKYSTEALSVDRHQRTLRGSINSRGDFGTGSEEVHVCYIAAHSREQPQGTECCRESAIDSVIERRCAPRRRSLYETCSGSSKESAANQLETCERRRRRTCC